MLLAGDRAMHHGHMARSLFRDRLDTVSQGSRAELMAAFEPASSVSATRAKTFSLVVLIVSKGSPDRFHHVSCDEAFAPLAHADMVLGPPVVARTRSRALLLAWDQQNATAAVRWRPSPFRASRVITSFQTHDARGIIRGWTL